MRFLYNLLFHLGFGLSAPFYFLKMWRRGNWQKGFAQRFGNHTSKTKQALSNRQVVWFHAVSVGEVNLCTQLVRHIENRAPNIKVVISTTTSTGMAELQKKFPSRFEKIYYPIDRKSSVTNALLSVHPCAIVLVEAEIWPNFLWTAEELGVPVVLVNARVSERSFRGYKRFGLLFRNIFHNFAAIGCQNDEDRQRLIKLGARPEVIHAVGNLKFDALPIPEVRPLDVHSFLKQLGVSEDALILIGGSTHAGEELILANLYRALKPSFPNLFLILVPRHFERSKEAGSDLQKAGLRFVYRSELGSSARLACNSLDCLLVNTTGELKYFYEAASVVFIGKSLTAEGGQNPIEPAALEKPVVFGPNMQNFRPIVESLLAGNGAIQVPDAAGLQTAVEELLRNPDRRQQVGKAGRLIVEENAGGLEKTVNLVVDVLAAQDVYIAR